MHLIKLFFLCVLLHLSQYTIAQTTHNQKSGKSDINSGNTWNPNGGNPTNFNNNTGDTWNCNAAASSSAATNLGSTFNVTSSATLTITSGITFTVASTGTLDNQSGSTINLDASNNLSVSGTVTNSSTFNGNGAISVLSGGNFTNASSGTLNINSTFSNAGTTTLNGNVTINGSLTNSGTLNINGTLTVIGTLSNSGTITCGASSTVTYNGSTSQDVVAASFQNLTINNSSGTVLSGNTTVNGTLTMTSGLIQLGSNTLSVNGTISGMSSSNSFSSNKSSSLTFGSGASGTIFMNSGSDDSTNQITNLDFDGSVTLGNSLKVSGIITPSGGTITTANSLYSVSSADNVYGQIAVGTGAFSGDVHFQMYVDSGYHQIGSAVSTEIQDLNQGGYLSDGSVYYWDASTSNWTIADTTSQFGAGTGYYAYLGKVSRDFTYFLETPSAIDLQGAPNTGNISIPLYYHDGTGSNASFGVAGAGGWNLVSNPYPSQLDWESITLPSNLNDAFYIYKPSDGSYTSYVNGSGTNGGTQYIAPMQGIFVQTTSGLGAGSVNLDLTNSHRVTNQGTVFYKNGSPFESLRLQLTNLTSNQKDEHVVRFTQGATSLFDGPFDAVKFENGNKIPNLYALDKNNKSYSINTLPTFDVNYSYPITVHPKYANQDFEISVLLEDNTDNWRVYLEDKVLKKYHDLNSSAYKFKSQIAETNSSRFVVHFVKQRDITSVKSLNNANFTLRQTQESVYINLPISGIAPVYLQLYDLQGKLVWVGEESIVGEQKIDLPGSLQGAYVLKAAYLNQEESIKLLR